jgi:kynureninase
LAHTIGNIDVQMHNWNVDFATYCTYKFTNSGPHNFGGLFLHQKYFNQQINNCFISGYYCYEDELKYKEGASMLTLTPPNDL